MEFVIILTVLLAYYSFIIWFVKDRYLPKYYVTITRVDSSASPYRLARVVRQILSFIHWLLFIYVIVYLPICIPMCSPQISNCCGADLLLYAYFKLDLSMLASLETSGLHGQIIKHRGHLIINTSNHFAWYLMSIWEYLACLSYLYGALQIRNILVSLNLGKAFTRKNSTRLNRMAVLILFWQVATPLLQYFGCGTVLKDISFNTQAIQLEPSFAVEWRFIILGLLFLVLSGVLKEAVKIKNENRLTI